MRDEIYDNLVKMLEKYQDSLIEQIEQNNNLLKRILNCIMKIECMFRNGDTDHIIDDLIELESILTGEKDE